MAVHSRQGKPQTLRGRTIYWSPEGVNRARSYGTLGANREMSWFKPFPAIPGRADDLGMAEGLALDFEDAPAQPARRVDLGSRREQGLDGRCRLDHEVVTRFSEGMGAADRRPLQERSREASKRPTPLGGPRECRSGGRAVGRRKRGSRADRRDRWPVGLASAASRGSDPTSS